jgi:hypothetical protein
MRIYTEHPNFREDFYNEWITTENKKKMAENIRGTVQRTNERQIQGRNGPLTMRSFKVNDVWYSNGTKAVPPEGTLVEFAAEKNQRGFWDVTKAGITQVQAGAPMQAVGVQAVQYAANTPMSKDDYWRRKEERDLAKEAEFAARDRRIELQSCRNSALQLVDILLRPIQTKDGAELLVKLPAQNKRVEFVEKLVQQYTDQFVFANNNKNEDIPTNGNSETISDSSPAVVSADDPVWEV